MGIILPSYTIEQYTALVAAIAEGTTRVKYQDKEVEYRSLKEMKEIKGDMEAVLFPNDVATGPRRVTAIHSKGFY